MKEIVIFKTDRIGDFINFSPCLKILKDNLNDSKITVICSRYNYKIVKNYKEIDKIIILNKNILLDFINLSKNIFLKKFDYLFQFDGNKNSYLFSLFIRAKNKSTIFFFKDLFIFKFKFRRFRPNFILRLFFNNFVFCNEDYNIKIHYQRLYFQLMTNLKFKITSKKNIFYLDQHHKEDHLKISKILGNKYFLFHIDNKSDKLNSSQFFSLISFIKKINKENKVLITLGVEEIIHKDLLKKNFKSYIYNDFANTVSSNDKLFLIEDLPLNLFAYLVANSTANYSMHSGSVVHISAAFDRLIVDIIQKHKYLEIDRWVPLVSKYKRIDLDNL